MYYFNNAGAGIMSDATLNAIMNYYEQERVMGAYQAANANKDKIENFYSNVAQLIHAKDQSEIAFVDSASRGWNLALSSIPLGKGDTIITISSEFGTNLITLYNLSVNTGSMLHIVKCDPSGYFDINEIEMILQNATGTKLIALSQSAAQGAIINPVVEIGQLAKKYGAFYVVDGCQSVGHIESNVQDIACDAYMTSGRKWLCGPRGTGFLYIKANSNMKPSQLDLASADLLLDNCTNIQGMDIRRDAKRFELWERNIAAVVGFSNAISEFLLIDSQEFASALFRKAEKITEAVMHNNNLTLVGNSKVKYGIIGFYAKDSALELKIKDILKKHDIVCSIISDYDCPLFFPQNGVSSIFRISPHYNTPQSAIDEVCVAIAEI